MKLRQLTINNFRGIRQMEWNLTGDMVCLVGPGDSTKSTVLLALEYLFSPSWNLAVSGADYHQMNGENPIEISAVVAELPSTIITEDRFGLFLGFWNEKDGVHKEQKDEHDQKALQIRLTIGPDLEPEWMISSLQEGERQERISATDRRMLGMAKIGNYTEAALSWGRNSAMSRLTQKDDAKQIPSMLAEAERNVLEALKDMNFGTLAQAIEDIGRSSRSLGVDIQSELRAGMDPARVSLRQGAIALFDGNLPVALRGAGSRRLMVMAAHKASVKEGAIILIDEIENSLEPYRLRNLIRQLRPNDTDNHQVIFTTHSPVAVVECHSTELCVVRSKDSTTTIKAVGEHLQSVVRNIPEAFLVRKVIVCEGKTEAGLLISLDRHYWQQRLQNNPSGQSAQFQTMAEAGVAPIESPKSGGSAAPKYAVDLARLGYRVAYFGDSDLYLKPSSNEMMGSGVEKVLIWSGNVEIERRLCFDLPWKGVTELVALAIRLQGSDASVWDKIYGTLQKANLRFTRKADLDSLRLDIEEIALRESIGKAADDGEWFKRMDKGKALGIMLASYLDDMQDTPTCENLQDLARWSYVG